MFELDLFNNWSGNPEKSVSIEQYSSGLTFVQYKVIELSSNYRIDLERIAFCVL